MDKNEVDKFFEALPSENKQVQDVFNEKPPQEEAPSEQKEVPQEPEKDEKKEPETHKNRAYRRLEDQWQKERESNIALNERVRSLAEQIQFLQNTNLQKDTEVPAEWTQLMGDSPQAAKAWEIQQKLIRDATLQAKAEALEEFQEQQNKSYEEQRQYEELIDDQLLSLEDQYNVDLTSNSPGARKARREFLEMVQQLSPKDENGIITDYADFGSTFDLYQRTRTNERQNTSVQKQKEMASKSMQQPQGSGFNNETQQGPMTWDVAKAVINKLNN